jgi:hypothetical protein
MKEFSVGHRCNFCGQEIAYLVPDSPEEAFGVLFQERTFIELRLALTHDPSQRVAEYRYCSDYCAREDLDLRISRRNEKMRHFREANTLSFWSAQPRGATGKDRA